MSADAIAPHVADIYLLTVVSQTRSFTQAARRLGISKASVSGRIHDLERSLGLPLVRRTTRSVSMTEAGQLLVSGAQNAFGALYDSVNAARQTMDQPRGLVRVSAPVAFGRQHLAPLVTPFLQAYPEVTLELDLADRFVNLENEGFDLAVRHADTVPESYVAWPLLTTEAGLLASPDYVARHGTPTHPDDLGGHICLHYLRPGVADIWSFVPRAEACARIDVPIRVRFRANNSEALRDAVRGGLGIGLLPDFSALAGTADLVPILPDWRVIGFFGQTIHALRPWSATVPPAVRCLVDFLRTHLPAQVRGIAPPRDIPE
ncbi:LysR family transcriptional regulator [Achromobacter aloeverae]|uniref:LysR family transcriptional regulator n=1 Tax=Achromobacter aloeverae TaxID=1750518 RepID=A0A4Q1HMT7_9BURK|nr:LysR family transcriptional regulator [Achromobacter aloeverae]RXN91520.1 LysR family transcriptional regulator [Achromobacter aloeverae]